MKNHQHLRSLARRQFRVAPLHISCCRAFSASSTNLTDGVYKELTAMRTKQPYIEALRTHEQHHESTASKAAPPKLTERDIRPKRMSDSYHAVRIPLGHDPWLLDSYITSTGTIRLGTLFMDLDALAGVVSYKHTGDSVITVTAAVDKIALKRPLSKICDLELSGRVTFATGRSSMEVGCMVKSVDEDGQPGEVLMECAFTMVSLDPTTKKPVPISPLLIETEEERQLYEQGERHYHDKKLVAKTALKKQAPNEEEARLIHSLWRTQRDYKDPETPSSASPTTLSMSTTRISSVQIMQPQYRNRHQTMIFGGFLLRSTFELAYTCIASIPTNSNSESHSRPTFLSLDPSTFDNPVPVGSTLYLSAEVAYTDSPLLENAALASANAAQANTSISTFTSQHPKLSPTGRTRVQVRVDSKVRDMETGETKRTGQFNYNFEIDGDVEVFPETYGEFMVYLDARRRCLVHVEGER